MVYIDISYEGRRPALSTVRDAVLRGLAKDYTGTYTFIKVEFVKQYNEFHFVFEAEDEEDFINFGFNDLGSSLPDNIQPSGSGHEVKPKEIHWIVTIANYDEAGEGLAVFAPFVCENEKQVANFINQNMRASFQNEGWTIKGKIAYPPNYKPRKDKPIPFPQYTAKQIENNTEFATPNEIQLWAKWKVTKWEM